jgi:predicted Zn-dependent protease
MKKYFAFFSFLVLSVLLTSQGGFGGFFDDLLKPPPKQQKADKPQGTEKTPAQSEQKEPDLIEGLGGIFGAKEKDIKLFKKGVGVAQALQPIGEEEEIALGQSVALEAFSRFGGEYHNESLTRYLNLVGKTVAEISDRPNLNYHFAILNSREQNAFAAPGGYIFVTIGLLKTLKDEAELAGVLAHEIAHVTQKHMLKTIQRGAVLSSATEFTLTAMEKDPEMYANVIDEITDKLFTKGLDKDLEYEADVYGIEFAYRAGYNPNGLRNYLKTLQAQKGIAKSAFFTTHPPTEERISKINSTLRNYSDGATLAILKERFQKYIRSS